MPSVLRDDRRGARAACEVGQACAEQARDGAPPDGGTRHQSRQRLALPPHRRCPAARHATAAGGGQDRPPFPAKGGQSCPPEGTYLSGKGGQERPPNKEKELKPRTAAAAPDLPEKGQSGTAPARSAPPSPLVFVPQGICFARDWNDRLAQEGLATLDRSLPLAVNGPHRGFWVPARSPAPRGSPEWREQVRQLRCLAGKDAGQREQRHAG